MILRDDSRPGMPDRHEDWIKDTTRAGRYRYTLIDRSRSIAVYMSVPPHVLDTSRLFIEGTPYDLNELHTHLLLLLPQEEANEWVNNYLLSRSKSW